MVLDALNVIASYFFIVTPLENKWILYCRGRSSSVFKVIRLQNGLPWGAIVV